MGWCLAQPESVQNLETPQPAENLDKHPKPANPLICWAHRQNIMMFPANPNREFKTMKHIDTMTLVAIAGASFAAHAQLFTITEQQPVFAPDAGLFDRFGYTVAIDGNTALISATRRTAIEIPPIDMGGVYVYDIAQGTFGPVLTVANDGVDFTDFGVSIDVSGEIAVVGASGQSKAYLFNVLTGEQTAVLAPPGSNPRASFGTAVAIRSDRVLVGFPNDSQQSFNSCGSASIFDANSGTLIFRLLATDRDDTDLFGSSVDIHGGIAVIGAPKDDDLGGQSGSAYLFDVASGTQLHKLLPQDGGPSQDFGTAVAISGNLVVIGAPYDNDQGTRSGSAYIFDASTGQQIHKLLPREGTAQANFGSTVAISGNTVVVGSPGLNNFTGEAHVFEADTGRVIARLSSSQVANNDNFGFSVATSTTQIIVGAHRVDEIASDAGAAYLFAVPEACNAADIEPPLGWLDFFDVSAFLAGYNSASPIADLAEPFGVLNFADVSAFLSSFSAGCP